MQYEHAGHRKRMWTKLHGGAVLSNQELLEMFLYSGLPRKNTSDLAHRLLASFGSLEGVFDASVEELLSIEGVGNSVAESIYTAGCLYRRLSQRKQNKFIGKYGADEFIPYVKLTYASESWEVIDVYLLDEQGTVRGVKRFTDRDAHTVKLDMKELSRFLMEHHSAGIVVVHNHPVGPSVASSADDEMTKSCQILCNLYNMLLCDHIIYSPEGIYSYYMDGKMEEISKSFSINRLTREGGDVAED